MKTGRRFYPRPYFVTAAVDLSFNNWILISNRYRAKNFKQVPVSSHATLFFPQLSQRNCLQVRLRSRLALMAQIRGSNRIRLVPQPTCANYCPEIELTLFEGEMG